MGAAAVLHGDAGALREQEAVVTLAALKAAAGAAREAGQSGTGALAGARAGGVVAVGRALERCGGGERAGSGLWVSGPALGIPRTGSGLACWGHQL